MRQASGDLFPSDSPIPASQMIGRRDDVREIATRLEAGTHLVVAGPRRTGKTSVCEAALTRARRRGAYVASLDLFRVADAAELAEALATAVIANRSASHRLLRRARSAGRAALSAAQARAVVRLVGELGEGVEVALTPGLAAQDPDRALDLALELPERVAIADDRRLLLFFDEFQEVASARRPYGDPDAVTNRMRAVFQRSTAVSYLFAGSIEHVMRDLFAPSRRAFSGFGSFYALRPIERGGVAPRPARALRRRRVRDRRRRARPDRRAGRRPPARDDADRAAGAPRLARARHPRDRPGPRPGRLRARARGRPADDGAGGRADPPAAQERAAGGAHRGGGSAAAAAPAPGRPRSRAQAAARRGHRRARGARRAGG